MGGEALLVLDPLLDEFQVQVVDGVVVVDVPVDGQVGVDIESRLDLSPLRDMYAAIPVTVMTFVVFPLSMVINPV